MEDLDYTVDSYNWVGLMKEVNEMLVRSGRSVKASCDEDTDGAECLRLGFMYIYHNPVTKLFDLYFLNDDEDDYWDEKGFTKLQVLGRILKDVDNLFIDSRR